MSANKLATNLDYYVHMKKGVEDIDFSLLFILLHIRKYIYIISCNIYYIIFTCITSTLTQCCTDICISYIIFILVLYILYKFIFYIIFIYGKTTCWFQINMLISICIFYMIFILLFFLLIIYNSLLYFLSQGGGSVPRCTI